MPINLDELPPEMRTQFEMFELLLGQMTTDALDGLIAFLTEKRDDRHS